MNFTKTVVKEMPIKEIKKILILQIAGIGDLVMVSPTLKALRDRYEDADIKLLVISRSAELIRGCPDIDDLSVLDIEYTNLMNLFKREVFIKAYKTIKELRQQRFNMLINLQNISSWRGSFKIAILFWLIGAKYKVGRDTDGRGLFFNFKIKENSQEHKHEVEVNLDVARALGASIGEVKLEIPIFEKDKIFISNFLTQYGIADKDLLIGLNPGTFRPSREWFEKRWAQLADKLIGEYGCKVIVTGSESKRKMINELENLMEKRPIITATNLTLKQLTALIKRLNLFITNDTGPMHIAAATKTPLIALFGPSDIHRFSPYCDREQYIIIRKELNCKRPCYKFKCKNRKCMELINVEDVMKAVNTILIRCQK